MARQTVKAVIKKEAQRPKVKKTIDLKQLIDMIVHEANVLIAQEHLKNYKRIRKIIVDLWYAEYSPYEYQRKRSMYYFAYPHIEGEYFFVDYGVDNYYGHHRASPEVIYANSFQQGWHGGAFRGPKHPAKGVPYYRTPSPKYPYWSRSAVPGFSIEETLMGEWDSYCSGEGHTIAINILTQVILKYRDYIIALIRAMQNI